MGDDLESIILLDPVKPGDKVLVAVKLLQTVDKKHFEEATVRVAFADNRPSPLDLLQEIQSVWALIPSLGDKSGTVQAGLEKAAKAVDLQRLRDAKQQALTPPLCCPCGVAGIEAGPARNLRELDRQRPH